MTSRNETISVGHAVLIGMLWVNGAVLVGFILPLAAFAGGASLMDGGPVNVWVGAGGLAAALGLSVICGWLIWASQITRWRLWAYRRVDDIPALKAAAISASLIWPDGHSCERTEFRSRDQAAELTRLEQAASARRAAGMASPERAPTRLGTAGKAILLGVVLMPLCVLAPAGLLGMVDVPVTDSPVFRALLFIFPIALAGLIYWRAVRDGVSADEGFRRILPHWLRAKRDEA